MSLPENITAIVARNETWSGDAATEPYEVGWAREAVFFVRALKDPVGAPVEAVVEFSPDGIRWIPEGTRFALPDAVDAITSARLARFGGWLRLSAHFPAGSEARLLVTLHLKA